MCINNAMTLTFTINILNSFRWWIPFDELRLWLLGVKGSRHAQCRGIFRKSNWSWKRIKHLHNSWWRRKPYMPEASQVVFLSIHYSFWCISLQTATCVSWGGTVFAREVSPVVSAAGPFFMNTCWVLYNLC